MRLPKYYYDVVNFEKEFKYEIIYDQPKQSTEMINEDIGIEKKKEEEYVPETEILCKNKKIYANLFIKKKFSNNNKKRIFELRKNQKYHKN